MQPIRPAATGHRASGKFVHDDDLALADDVILVALEQVLGFHRRFEVVHHFHLLGVYFFRAIRVDQGRAQQLFDVVVTRFTQRDGARARINLVIVLVQFADHFGQAVVFVRGLARGTRNDERGARFVNEDVVNFVHDRVIKLALDAVFEPPGHVVAQIVKAEFVVRAVGDVGGVHFAALDYAHVIHFRCCRFEFGIEDQGVLFALLQRSDRQAQEMIHRAHQLRMEAR